MRENHAICVRVGNPDENINGFSFDFVVLLTLAVGVKLNIII